MKSRRRGAKDLLQIAKAASRPANPTCAREMSKFLSSSLPVIQPRLSRSLSTLFSPLLHSKVAVSEAFASSVPSRNITTAARSSLSPISSTVSGGFSASLLPRVASSRISSPCLPAGVSLRAFSSSARSPSSSWYARYIGYSVLLVGSGLLTYFYYPHPQRTRPTPTLPDEHTVANWSGTHEATTRVYVQPESLEELELVVKLANEKRQRIRAVGSGLSPNGIGLSDEGMINLALMDKVLSVDQETKTVRVQAGARVAEVVEALRPHGLTLQNYASIREQQIGGFIQVGAHGTGARLPPVDEQVVSLKLVTPGKGTLDLSAQSDGDLFYLARCGLGVLGVVAEVTLQCVSAHKLLERTFVANIKHVKKNHKKWLQENKHLRYMWIPDTDSIVVVQCNLLPEGQVPKEETTAHQYGVDDRMSAARYLYKEVAAKYLPEGDHSNTKQVQGATRPPVEAGLWGGSSAGSRDPLGHLSEEELNSLSFTELRDKLLAFDPLNKSHVTKVNQAEAEYWKKSEGYRIGWSDEILGFDCGGQQWVSEVCFPAGTIQKPNMQDIKYIEKVLQLIKKEGFPAPAPIEQRWTASSRSPLSPAYSPSPDTLYSWVGIIMYLPTLDEEQRAAITNFFFEYRKATQHQLWDSYGAHEHWAKIEVPQDENSLEWVRERIRQRYRTENLNQARVELDPNNILANDFIDKLFPRPASMVISL